ncbi:MAG: siderophore-interacting protein [Pseudomonadota bacterium]
MNAKPWITPRVDHALPSKFSFARAYKVEPLGANFLRVKLESHDLSTYDDSSIHFRFVLPNRGGPTLWPTVAANGSIAWAEGDQAAHKPVYTARTVDHARNELVVDVFIHEGGRTTDWALEIMAGETARAVVGLVGPSGGGLLTADQVLMGSDETGFPAVARLLENLPETAMGHLYLEAEHGAACDYPLAPPGGIAVTWLSRANGDMLADVVIKAMPGHEGAHVWFAGERSEAMRVRDVALKAGWDKETLRISGFWRAA